MDVGLFQLDGEAEVEQDDASVTVDEHVGGLYVAMELAGVVERRDPRGELPERRAKASESGQRQVGLPQRTRRVAYIRCPSPDDDVVGVGYATVSASSVSSGRPPGV